MAHRFDGTAHSRLVDNAIGLTPAGRWTISGWARGHKWDGTGVQFLFSVRDPDTDWRVQLYYREHQAGGSNYGLFTLQYVPPSGFGFTANLRSLQPALWLKDNLNRWYFFCIGYRPGTISFRQYIPATGVLYNSSLSRTYQAMPASNGVYFGAVDTGGAPFQGDLANWSMLDGVDAIENYNVWNSLCRDGRAFKMEACRWHAPMQAGAFGEWVGRVPHEGVNVQESLSYPRLNLITPQSFDLFDYVDPAILLPIHSAIPITDDCTVEHIPRQQSASAIVLESDGDVAATFSRKATSPLVIYDEVTYVGPVWASAHDLIQIQDDNRFPETYVRTVSTPIVFAQSATTGGTKRLQASSKLTVSQIADNIVKMRQASSLISITDSTAVDRVKNVRQTIPISQDVILGSMSLKVSQKINVTQWVRWNPLPRDASNTITLTQSARSSIRNLTATSTIVVGHSHALIRPVHLTVEDTLTVTESQFDGSGFVETLVGLRDSASLKPTVERQGENVLAVGQTAEFVRLRADAIEAITSSAILIGHAARLSETAAGTTLLYVWDESDVVAGRPSGSILLPTDFAQVTINRSPNAESTIIVRQSVAYTRILGSTHSQYSPFLGDGDGPTVPATLHGPMAGIQVPFQLVHPSVGPVTDAVSLRSPNFGNKDRLAFNRIARETRGGTVIVFADPDWPQTQTQVLQFSGLLRVEAQTLLKFIEDHLGDEVGMIDWEHRYWRGIITTPDEPVIEDSFDRCTASFQFEGELDPTWNPQVVPPTLRYSATQSTQKDGHYVPNEPILPVAPSVEYLSAETDDALVVGQPLYMKNNGHLALAGNATQPCVLGLSISAKASGTGAYYLTEGTVTRTDWTPITGAEHLAAGATYFLGDTGRLSTTPPSTVGQYVVRVGRAVSTTTLDIEIELPILL